MEEVYKKMDLIVQNIINSDEYKKCCEIKDKMKDNAVLNKKINDVRLLQKKYVRSGYDENIKVELDKLNKELLDIPIYKVYLDNLEIVNEKIDYVRDSLNEYFDDVFNKIGTN